MQGSELIKVLLKTALFTIYYKTSIILSLLKIVTFKFTMDILTILTVSGKLSTWIIAPQLGLGFGLGLVLELGMGGNFLRGQLS